MCTQPPADPLTVLKKERDRLLRIMTSGVQEVEQPQLGRTQYRSMEDLAQALLALNSQIAMLDPVVDPNAWRRQRRPIHPVVTEL